MSEPRRFGLLVGGVLVAVGVLLIVFRGWGGAAFAGVGLLLMILGTVAPRGLEPLAKRWMALARALGWFHTRVLLGVVFFLILPVARLYLILRGRDPMTRRLDKDAESYWTVLDEKPFDPESLERPF